MFSKKFISFTVISGVLASTISQLGFAENDNVDSLETLSSSEDLAVKDETEKVEDLNKNENSGDDSSTDVEDLEGGEDNEDHEGTENKARSVVNLYQRGKEALVNKFENVKPYLKKGKDVLKKVVSHDAFLPTFTGLASAAGTYKLLEKLNNRNTTNEHLTQVQVPEQPQEDVVTPSSTTQQDTSSEEEINKKSDTENNDSDVTNTSDLPQNDQVVDEKDNRVRDSVIFAFVILILGGATVAYRLLKTKYVPKRNEKYSRVIKYLKELEVKLLDRMKTRTGNIMADELLTFKVPKTSTTQNCPLYDYLKKVGFIKGDEESVKVTIFPYFALNLENFEDISGAKVHLRLMNMYINGQKVEGNEKRLRLKRVNADSENTHDFHYDVLGLDLTFNLGNRVENCALAQLIQLMDRFAEANTLTEEQQKDNDIKAILGNLLVHTGDYDGNIGNVVNFAELKQLFSEVDLYEALCKVCGIRINEGMELKKDTEFVKKIINTEPVTSLKVKGDMETVDIDTTENINRISVKKENNEDARTKSKNIEAILENLLANEGGVHLEGDVILNENDLFAILKEKFLNIKMPEAQRKRIFEKPKKKQNIIPLNSYQYNSNNAFKNEKEYDNINQNDIITEENYGDFNNESKKGSSELNQNQNDITISKNDSIESNGGNNNIDDNNFKDENNFNSYNIGAGETEN